MCITMRHYYPLGKFQGTYLYSTGVICSYSFREQLYLHKQNFIVPNIFRLTTLPAPMATSNPKLKTTEGDPRDSLTVEIK